MSQNVVSLALSAEQLDQANRGLGMLEQSLVDLLSLSVEQRQELRKMGPKSETFARKAHDVLSLSPEILPGTFSLREFSADIKALDQLRPVFARPFTWKVLDVLIGLTMAALALKLLLGE